MGEKNKKGKEQGRSFPHFSSRKGRIEGAGNEPGKPSEQVPYLASQRPVWFTASGQGRRETKDYRRKEATTHGTGLAESSTNNASILNPVSTRRMYEVRWETLQLCCPGRRGENRGKNDVAARRILDRPAAVPSFIFILHLGWVGFFLCVQFLQCFSKVGFDDF